MIEQIHLFSGSNAGVWPSNHSIDLKTEHSSSASAYYEPVKANSNLLILTGVQATRVIFINSSLDASGNLVASGVEYSKDDQLYRVSSTKEVLLCAGSFKTPQLLELSGIGDKNILQAHGIHVNLDLPAVGTNLRKSSILFHFLIFCQRFVRNNSGSTVQAGPLLLPLLLRVTRITTGDPAALGKRPTRSRPLGQTSEGRLSGNDVPFLECAEQASVNSIFAERHLRVALFPGFMSMPGRKPEAGKSYFSYFLMLAHPFSSGTVHITSSDPLAAPMIDHAVLDNAVNVGILVQASKFARKLSATPNLN
ncbi:GMC oxidoreductase-domain-containing protein [Mycena galopus ATCC 62051]|nr:GMC oxidoreductase-domain-containing protein [Mycena galopus ATCC 62051]